MNPHSLMPLRDPHSPEEEPQGPYGNDSLAPLAGVLLLSMLAAVALLVNIDWATF